MADMIGPALKEMRVARGERLMDVRDRTGLPMWKVQDSERPSKNFAFETLMPLLHDVYGCDLYDLADAFYALRAKEHGGDFKPRIPFDQRERVVELLDEATRGLRDVRAERVAEMEEELARSRESVDSLTRVLDRLSASARGTDAAAEGHTVGDSRKVG